MEDVDLSHIFFRYSPALRAIQEDGLNIVVVKPDLSFEAVLLGLPDAMESTKGTSGFVKAGLDAFLGTIVTAYEASKICEIFNALQCLSIDGDWGYCWGIDAHHLGLFMVDVQTSSLCKIA